MNATNGTLKPALLSGDTFQAYRNAMEVLTCRMLAEPYSMYLIIDRVNDSMFLGDDEIAIACVELFREKKTYSAFTVSQRIKIHDTVINKSLRHSDVSLLEAFEFFEFAYGQWIETEISNQIYTWTKAGLTSEEIQLEQNKFRKLKGLNSFVKSNDGRDEFENELKASIEGRIIKHPVRPPLTAMREFIPYFEPGDYIITAGRTAMGKSDALIDCLYQCALDDVPALYINLENQPKHVQKRLWQRRAGTRFERDMSRDVHRHEQYLADWDWIKGCPISAINPGRSCSAIVNQIRRAYMEKGIQFAAIDYVQLMREAEKNQNKTYELGDISAAIRALSLELNIPIMAAAQVSRGAENSANKRPELSDLKDCGGFEQDATFVFFIYRPSYYKILTNEDGEPYPDNYADFHIAKGRETGNAYIKCRYEGGRGFYDPDEERNFPTVAPLDYTIPRKELDENLPF
ncbi:MAG: DnaB-like helicase C-terminal domain-containing protein [Saprospiraceae bacterium]